MSQGASLISTQNLVETPFIIVDIGPYRFGHCAKPDGKSRLFKHFNIEYPNYMESLSITKVNGAVNTYVLNMIYAITERDDPNRLEKVFSSISNSRMITLHYGDWESPAFIYKDEEAIITKLSTKVNLKNSTISYTVYCTSNALTLTAVTSSFPAKFAKPSDEIIRLLKTKNYGLTDVFKGMKNIDFDSFIARDDIPVLLEAKPSMNVVDYISYLVSCMSYKGESISNRLRGLKSSCYFWSVYDDVSNKYGGTYFKVVRVDSNSSTLVSYNTYEVDVGFPTNAAVMDFNINNDDSWSLLYNYANEVHLPGYSYTIDSDGNLVQTDSPTLTASQKTFETNEATRNWWSLVTQFPITATLTIKGLLRPTMLMSYVKVNTYFYGHKHTSSGLYIITKQEDSISSSGYRTTLALTRVGGDEQFV